MMTRGDGPLSARRPDATHHRFQTETVLIGGESLDYRLWMFGLFLRNRFGEVFLKISCSSGVAALAWQGRGFWIDQPIVCNASQPRCTATDVTPNSAAIKAATLREVHTPPSSGGLCS